jgi:hypothetical protein
MGRLLNGENIGQFVTILRDHTLTIVRDSQTDVAVVSAAATALSVRADPMIVCIMIIGTIGQTKKLVRK